MMSTEELAEARQHDRPHEAAPERSQAVACKICGSPAREAFRIPKSKKSGHPIPDLPDDCAYYECGTCGFCFSTILDSEDHTELYDETYWTGQDPDWHGRVSETLRLVLLGSQLVRRPPDTLEILDFGCGMGTFVETCRKSLQLDAWGTDIIRPKFGVEYFLPKVDRKFDIVVACEVIEHLPRPAETFRAIRSMLKPGGVFAFQTAEYDRSAGRNWWYVGPDNGHISFYSRGAFDTLFAQLSGRSRLFWRDYPGVQAWQFEAPSGGAPAAPSRSEPPLPMAEELTAWKQRLDAHDASFARLAQRLVSLEGRVSDLAGTLKSVSEKYARSDEELAAIRRSTSWRVTAPLRAFGRVLR